MDVWSLLDYVQHCLPRLGLQLVFSRRVKAINEQAEVEATNTSTMTQAGGAHMTDTITLAKKNTVGWEGSNTHQEKKINEKPDDEKVQLPNFLRQGACSGLIRWRNLHPSRLYPEKVPDPNPPSVLLVRRTPNKKNPVSHTNEGECVGTYRQTYPPFWRLSLPTKIQRNCLFFPRACRTDPWAVVETAELRTPGLLAVSDEGAKSRV